MVRKTLLKADILNQLHISGRKHLVSSALAWRKLSDEVSCWVQFVPTELWMISSNLGLHVWVSSPNHFRSSARRTGHVTDEVTGPHINPKVIRHANMPTWMRTIRIRWNDKRTFSFYFGDINWNEGLQWLNTFYYHRQNSPKTKILLNIFITCFLWSSDKNLWKDINSSFLINLWPTKS